MAIQGLILSNYGQVRIEVKLRSVYFECINNMLKRFPLNPPLVVCLLLLIVVVAFLEEVHRRSELMDEVPVMVVRALKVNMLRLVVEKVD